MSTNPEAPRNPDAVRDAIQRQRQSIDGRNIFKMTEEESRKFRSDTEQLQKQLLDSIRDTEQRALDEEISGQNRLTVGLGTAGLVLLPATPLLAAASAYSYFNRTKIEDYIDRRGKGLADRYGVRMTVVLDGSGNKKIGIEPLSDQGRQEGDIFQTLRPDNPNRQQTVQRLTVDAQLATSELAGLLRNNQRLDSPAVVTILGSMHVALQSIGRVDSNFMVDLFRQMNQWLDASGIGYNFGASNPLELRRNAAPPAPGEQGGDAAGKSPEAVDFNQMNPVQRQEYLRAREQQLVDRVGDLVQALKTQGPSSSQVEAIRAELRAGLQALDKVDPNAGSLAFFAMNDRIWHTGYRLTTNPQGTVLNVEARPIGGRGSRKDYVVNILDQNERRTFLDRQRALIAKRSTDLLLALRKQGADAPQVEAIRLELHDWLRAIDEVDQGTGTVAFHDLNTGIQGTGYRLITDPHFGVLRFVRT